MTDRRGLMLDFLCYMVGWKIEATSRPNVVQEVRVARCGQEVSCAIIVAKKCLTAPQNSCILRLIWCLMSYKMVSRSGSTNKLIQAPRKCEND